MASSRSGSIRSKTTILRLSMSGGSIMWWLMHFLRDLQHSLMDVAQDTAFRDDTCRVMDDIIYYKNQIYLVPSSQLREKVLKTEHDSLLARHLGFLKTYRAVRKCFTWRDLKKNELRYVQECNTC